MGTVGTLEAHLATCEFTLVPCTNECKDDKNEITHIMRKDLNKHLEDDCLRRDHECEFCGEKGTYTHITQVHKKACENKIVPCPNADCTKTIQHKMKKQHLEHCEFSKIPCKYQTLGCEVMMMRKYMPAHEEDVKLHLHMALDKVVTLEEEITTVKNAIRKLTFEFQKKKKNNEDFHSSSFYSSPNGYHMKVEVVASGYDDGKGTHISVYIHMLEGKHDAKLKWPFIGNITIQILNQLENKNHHENIVHIVKETDMVVGVNWGHHKFIPHSKLAHDPVKNTQYLKDDTLYFRVSVNIPDRKPWLQCTVENLQ